jgi:hypothetical protein
MRIERALAFAHRRARPRPEQTWQSLVRKKHCMVCHKAPGARVHRPCPRFLQGAGDPSFSSSLPFHNDSKIVNAISLNAEKKKRVHVTSTGRTSEENQHHEGRHVGQRNVCEVGGKKSRHGIAAVGFRPACHVRPSSAPGKRAGESIQRDKYHEFPFPRSLGGGLFASGFGCVVMYSVVLCCPRSLACAWRL